MSAKLETPGELNGLEKLIMDVQKVIRDNELFLKRLGDDALEAGCDEEPNDDENGCDDGESFEEL